MHRKRSFGDLFSIRSREGVCRRRRQWVIDAIAARRWDASARRWIPPLSSRRRITNRRVPSLTRTFPKKKENPHTSPSTFHSSRTVTKSRVLQNAVQKQTQSMKITLSSSESIGEMSGSIERDVCRVLVRLDGATTGGSAKSNQPFAHPLARLQTSTTTDGRTATRRGWVKERDDDDGSNDRSV